MHNTLVFGILLMTAAAATAASAQNITTPNPLGASVLVVPEVSAESTNSDNIAPAFYTLNNRALERTWKAGAYVPRNAASHKLDGWRSFHLPRPPEGYHYCHADRPEKIAFVQNGTGRITFMFSIPKA